MAVSKRLRYEVLRRDNHTCKYCGQAAPSVKLTVDHVMPVSLGGADEPTNLVAACIDCNAGKSASNPDAPLVADVEQSAARWAQAMQIAVERRTAELAAEQERTAAFEAEWDNWTTRGVEVPRDPNWRNSILRFLAAGLTDEFIATAVRTAMGNTRIKTSDTWRYFCGICWREIDKLQAMAKQVLEQPDAVLPSPRVDEQQFDYMHMFDEFLDQLVRALGGDEQVRKYVDHCLWNEMPEAHRAWMDTFHNPPVLDEEETVRDAASDAAREQMSMGIAYDMHQVALWRGSRDRHMTAAGADDGS